MLLLNLILAGDRGLIVFQNCLLFAIFFLLKLAKNPFLVVCKGYKGDTQQLRCQLSAILFSSDLFFKYEISQTTPFHLAFLQSLDS